MFSSSEALARVLPAVMGGLVVLAPFVLREKLGRRAALIAAFGLALDPVMVAVSRQAGSPILALGFAVLAVAAWLYSKPVFAGVFAGLFLLSGLPAVPALVGIGITLGILFGSGNLQGWGEEKPAGLKTFLTVGGITLFVIGTLWMRYPQGLSAMLQAVPDYLAGWSPTSAAFSQVPLVQVLLALPIYQPVGLILAASVLLQTRMWQRRLPRLLAVLAVVLFALVAVYPSRQVSDLVWVLPLVWLLAGLGLAPHLEPLEKRERGIIWAQAVTIVALLAFWWANLVKTTRTFYINIPEGFRLSEFNTLDTLTKDYLGRMAIVVIIPFVLALLAAIVLTAWSKRIALHGALRGFGIFAVFYLIMVLFGINDMRPQQANELWNPPISSGYADDLRQALAELSEPAAGNRNDLEVVYQLDMALLHWQLRDMPNARFATVISPNENPAVIINDLFSLEEMNGTGVYRGEKIALQLYRIWGAQAFPSDFDRWLIYREAPVEKQWVVLWAREDIFIGYQTPSVETDLGEPVE
jgi:hypothetical protein